MKKWKFRDVDCWNESEWLKVVRLEKVERGGRIAPAADVVVDVADEEEEEEKEQ